MCICMYVCVMCLSQLFDLLTKQFVIFINSIHTANLSLNKREKKENINKNENSDTLIDKSIAKIYEVY